MIYIYIYMCVCVCVCVCVLYLVCPQLYCTHTHTHTHTHTDTHTHIYIYIYSYRHTSTSHCEYDLVGWGYRIHCLHLCRGIRPHNEYPGYDTKQSDGGATVMLERWWIRSTSLLPSLPGPLWHRVVAPDRVLSMGQIELNCILMPNWIVWNRTLWIFDCV